MRPGHVIVKCSSPKQVRNTRSTTKASNKTNKEGDINCVPNYTEKQQQQTLILPHTRQATICTKKNQFLWLRFREIEKRVKRKREREREIYRECRRWRFPWDRSAISSGNLAGASSSRPYPPLLNRRSKNPKNQ